ncbi:protein rolling stone-like [Penaeus chinensis]|nr:protein rolling stone-like [Penaeus chinensis]
METIVGYHNGASEYQVHFYDIKVERRRVGLQRVRDEFKIENLRLQHSAPHLFVSSQWQQHSRMSCLYLGYRIFWALYFSMWAVWAWVGSMGYDADISMKAYFLLYMTNWGVWTLAIDTIIQAINVILHFKKISEDGDAAYPTMTRLMKVSWVLSNITGALHIFITCAYWITVYPNRNDEKLSEIGVNTHIMPGMYTLLDIAVSATPRRLLHAYQPSAFLTIYTLFNLIYYLCGGVDYQGRPALYPVLDWTRPGTTISIMATVLLGLIPFLHAIICGLYAARVKAWRILRISRYVREEDETDQVEQAAQEQKV